MHNMVTKSKIFKEANGNVKATDSNGTTKKLNGAGTVHAHHEETSSSLTNTADDGDDLDGYDSTASDDHVQFGTKREYIFLIAVCASTFSRTVP